MALNVVHYENFTWTEVADLPRDLPMVLPLGDGFDFQVIADQLATGNFCILPALPYGWRGSLVDVGETLLQRVVAGILSAPHDDGFTRLIVLHDGEENLNMLGVHHLRVARTHSTSQSELHVSPERVIMISTGHVEQHGYHLPMNTDNVIIHAITNGVVKSIPDEAEMLPILPYGGLFNICVTRGNLFGD